MALGKIVLEAPLAVGLIVTAAWLSPWLAFWCCSRCRSRSFRWSRIAQRILARSLQVRRSGYVLFDVILQLLRGIRIIKAYRGEEREARAADRARPPLLRPADRPDARRVLGTVVLESLAGCSIVVVIIGRLRGGGRDARLAGAARVPDGGPRRSRTAQQRQYELHADAALQGAGVARLDELLAEQPEIDDGPDAVALAGAPASIALDAVRSATADDDPRRSHARGARRRDDRNRRPVGRRQDHAARPRRALLRPEHSARSASTAAISAATTGATSTASSRSSPRSHSCSPPRMRENIRCGRPDASDAEIEAAAQRRRGPRGDPGAAGWLRDDRGRGRPAPLGRSGAARQHCARAAQERAASCCSTNRPRASTRSRTSGCSARSSG